MPDDAPRERPSAAGRARAAAKARLLEDAQAQAGPSFVDTSGRSDAMIGRRADRSGPGLVARLDAATRRPVLRQSIATRALIVAAVVTLGLALLLSTTRVVDRLDHWLSDWRFTFAGERLAAPHPDLTVLLISEESLLDSPAYSPVDRALLAELIRKIDAWSPRAIGLDFLVDKRTDPAADQALVDAIKGARAPVVLGAFETRDADSTMLAEQRAVQEWFLGEVGDQPVGYFNIETDFDGVVRRRAPPATDGRPSSFPDALAEAAGAADAVARDTRLIDWLAPPTSGGAAFTTIYAHEAEAIFDFDVSAESAFRDRVVVIGAGLRPGAMTDYHQTPLNTANLQQTVGAEIVAQIVAQRLDGRLLYELGPFGSLLAAAAVAFLGALITLTLGRALLDSLLAVAALFALDLALFAMVDVALPLGALLASWAVAALLADRLRGEAQDM